MKSKYSFFQKATAFLMTAAMMLPILTVGATAQSMTKPEKAKSLTEDQKILHVLNRLGYGAREGDVEKVKSMGIKNYIEQQLNASSINDSATEARLSRFDVIKMSSDELFAKYPAPAAILQIVAQQNGMPGKELKAEVKADKADRKAAKNDGAMAAENGSMPNDQMKADRKPNNQNGAGETDREKYREQIAELYQKYQFGRPPEITQQLSASRIIRAAYSERQLQEQMVDFWSNHFNVYANKQSVRWFLPSYDRDVIRPNALGNFRDLLLATAESPAMLYFLDNFQSVAPDNEAGSNMDKQRERVQQLLNNPRARERFKQNQGLTDAEVDQRIKQMQQRIQQAGQRQPRGINENYAREIMELHTLGVDGGYSQKDIQEIARCFTGWTIVDARGYRKAAAAMVTGREDQRANRLARQTGAPDDAASGTFYFNEKVHDKGDKVVLGQTIKNDGVNDGRKVIDMLVSHPSTAKFIARKLAVKFVNDNPSEALVNHVADAFHKSNGDIKTTLRAMFNDPEFFAPENYRAKIKTPFEVTVSAIRAVGADTNGGQVQAMLAKMGEPLYNWQAPTGYPDTAEDWVNTGSLLERMNFAVALASNRIPGTKVNLSKFNITSTDKKTLLNQFVGVVLNGEVSDATRNTLLNQLEQPLMEPNMSVKSGDDEAAMENVAMARPNGQQKAPLGGRGGQQGRLLPPSGNPEVFKVVGLILGSPDFQRQ